LEASLKKPKKKRNASLSAIKYDSTSSFESNSKQRNFWQRKVYRSVDL